jgi:LemA protein
MIIPLAIGSGVILLIIIFMHNELVGKKNDVENAFGGMDIQLKKRFDLIPNLIAVVKQYMNHEKELLSKITELRAQTTESNISTDKMIDLDNRLTKEISGFMLNVENYPDLKSNQNFIQLQRSFNETESQISAARRAYNAAVTDYNNGVQMFPSSLVASMMNLKAKKVFEISKVERQNISASDLFRQ